MLANTRITMHGTMLCVRQSGILITGKPGIGKSSLAVDLLNRGHQLISDDATDLYPQQSYLIARCPPAIRGQLWLKNQGLMDVSLRWGNPSVKIQQRLDMIVHLQEDPETELAKKPLGVQMILSICIPRIVAVVKFKNLATFIEDLCSKKN